MSEFCMLFALLIGITVAETDQSINCSFSKISGVIKASHQHKTLTADSAIDCVRSGCGCNTFCVVSFHETSKRCLSVTLNALPIEWTKDCVMRSSNDIEWSSFANSAVLPSVVLPSGLWVMDSVCRGRNLGSKGPLLDSSETNVKWNAQGPHGRSSGITFARLDGSHRPVIKVRHEGIYLLDFTQPFSIAMWVRNDDINVWMPLLEGINEDDDTFAFHVWRNRSAVIDHLLVHGNEIIFTSENSTNILQWVHVSVVLKSGHSYNCYLNSNPWPLWHLEPKLIPRVQPDLIQIGFRLMESPRTFFRGSMACIVMYERALTADEIRSIMNMCP